MMDTSIFHRLESPRLPDAIVCSARFQSGGLKAHRLFKFPVFQTTLMMDTSLFHGLESPRLPDAIVCSVRIQSGGLKARRLFISRLPDDFDDGYFHIPQA